MVTHKAILRKTVDPGKMYAQSIRGEAMVLYPDQDPGETPICLRCVGPTTGENMTEARRLIANPQEIVDYLNAGEVEYETHIRWQLPYNMQTA
jgi:hypothetical protein